MKPIDAGALKDNLTDIYGNENRLVCLKDVLDLIGEQPDVVRPKEMMSCEVSEYIKRDVAISAIKKCNWQSGSRVQVHDGFLQCAVGYPYLRCGGGEAWEVGTREPNLSYMW